MTTTHRFTLGHRLEPDVPAYVRSLVPATRTVHGAGDWKLPGRRCGGRGSLLHSDDDGSAFYPDRHQWVHSDGESGCRCAEVTEACCPWVPTGGAR